MLKLFNRKKKDNKGFTLVELVIVIAILAILVGLLAPQYTKYVEKSRKAADASNMDEMVKVVKVYSADPANELAKGSYKITMHCDKQTADTDNTKIEGVDGATVPAELTKELNNSIPNWNKTLTKSKKWGTSGEKADIIATIEVKEDGGTTVTYSDSKNGTKFSDYVLNGKDTVTE